MSIASRPRLFVPPADFAPLPPELDSWAAFPDGLDVAVGLASATPEPFDSDLDLPWQSLAVTTRDELLDLAEGTELGMADGLARLAGDSHRRDLDEAIADGYTPADAVAEQGDQVLWSGNRVVAILRPLADGSLEDVRFPASGFLEGSPRRKGGGL